MNIQSGKVRSTSARRRQEPASSFGRKAAAIFQVVLVLLLIGGLANAYIYLNQKIAETDKKIREVNASIHQVDREIETLRVRREKFTAWPHIRDSIARFNLELRPAENGQVQRLAIIAPSVAPRVSIAEINPPPPAEKKQSLAKLRPAVLRRNAPSLPASRRLTR
ncbi:MAG: hypothetical protein J6R85_05910 [Lentisphaeria bacterium]|nr:hypothetical protein [Lentisphaeria bacterium]